MNISIFVASLKYIQTYTTICKLASWIYNELRSIYYTDDKLKRALRKTTYDKINTKMVRLEDDVIENIFELITNDFPRTEEWLRLWKISDKVVELLIKNGFPISHTKLKRFIKKAEKTNNLALLICLNERRKFIIESGRVIDSLS